MDSIAQVVLYIVGFILGFLILSFIFAYPLMLVWNYVVPSLTKGSLAEIGYWQAFWLNVLCTWLFKSNNTSQSK